MICDGGLAGCVLGSRLLQVGHSVTLLEADPEDYSKLIMSPMGGPRLLGSYYEFNYKSLPQQHLGKREIENHAGRMLSGSSGVNYGLWTRGHSADYDAWAKLVGDDHWGYDSMLKYFKQVEHHHDPNGDPTKFGFEGSVPPTAGARQYPLGHTMSDAFTQSGHLTNPTGNGGNTMGIARFTENWNEAKRNPASKAFDLSKATVYTESSVSHVVGDPYTMRVRRVLLQDGHTSVAPKEVLNCCGALKNASDSDALGHRA